LGRNGIYKIDFWLQEVLLFPAMKPDDQNANKEGADAAAEAKN